jgi:4-amino-4-deoxy-L-arabinose transferase-like glycosyltransferase
MTRRRWVWGMLLVLLVATALRAFGFGRLPPGLYHDEAYNGLDALDVLNGRFTPYFEANNGREPLYIYLAALSVGLFGRSPWALRLPALGVGVLTVAATGALGRALFSRRLGLLAAGILAVTLWHVHLSRVGLRAVLLPLLITLALWQGTRGQATGRRGHWLAAGVLYGLCFYSYMAARFTPLALAACVIYWRLLRRPVHVRHIGWAALACLATLLPLVAYTVSRPEIVLGRAAQVSITNPAIHHGDFWGTLGLHTLRALGMFSVRGDRIWRHNLPWRPVFDPLLGAAFVVGLWLALRRLRRAPAWGLVLIWTAVMLLPTLLAEDAPHFLRAVGVLPLIVFLPGSGLDWFSNWFSSWAGRQAARGRDGHRAMQIRRWVGVLAVGLPLLVALGLTAGDYFGRYAHDPMAGYWFEEGAVALAGEVNAFLGTGWDGTRLRHGTPGDRRVALDPDLWATWPQVRFLVQAREAVTVGLEGSPASHPVLIVVWPYGEWQRAWALLPNPAEVAVAPGPLSQGDRDPQPYTTYLAFRAWPAPGASPALARFSQGIELLSVTARSVDAERLQVLALWRASAALVEDYTVFVHLLRGGERIAQADAPPAGGYYPTTRWRPGDIVHDLHVMTGLNGVAPGRDALVIGLWLPVSGVQLDRLDEAGNPAGTWVEVPLAQVLEAGDAR